jgi:hypothetical protein
MSPACEARRRHLVAVMGYYAHASGREGRRGWREREERTLGIVDLYGILHGLHVAFTL